MAVYCFILHVISGLVYADDTQLYVSFKCKQPLEAISKLNSCLAHMRFGSHIRPISQLWWSYYCYM